MQAAIDARRLGHVFAPVWHARSGALYGFRAEMRFPDGTSPDEAVSPARERCGLGSLGKLSLPHGFSLRRMSTALSLLDLTPEVTRVAIHETSAVLRGSGFALGFLLHAPDLPVDNMQELEPELLAVAEDVWAGDGPGFAGLVDRARGQETLVLATGVRDGSGLSQLRRLGSELVTGPHLGRSAPASAWTPARVGLSWPREASL